MHRQHQNRLTNNVVGYTHYWVAWLWGSTRYYKMCDTCSETSIFNVISSQINTMDARGSRSGVYWLCFLAYIDDPSRFRTLIKCFLNEVINVTAVLWTIEQISKDKKLWYVTGHHIFPVPSVLAIKTTMSVVLCWLQRYGESIYNRKQWGFFLKLEALGVRWAAWLVVWLTITHRWSRVKKCDIQSTYALLCFMKDSDIVQLIITKSHSISYLHS